MRKIVEGISAFRRDIYPAHQERYRKLEAGQQPEVLLITCSDSRIDPALVTQTQPGELFVLRNAGNLVPRHGSAPGAEAATIEYAVNALGVRHIVICGHSHCGAMAAVLDPASTEQLPAVRGWLEAAGPERVDGDLDVQIRHNVRTQLDHLRTHPAVAQAEREGKLTLHGWVYDFGAGTIEALDPSKGSFVGLNELGTSHAAQT